MRSIKMMGVALVSVLALASTASAANWDPQGTILHGHGNLTLTIPSVGSVSCTVTLNTRASGAVAETVTAAGATTGPTFSGCSNSLGLPGTSVTSGTSWTATATSTTAVTVSQGNAVISLGGGICTYTASNVTVANNAWSNTTHTLTANSGVSFPITSSGFCPGGSSGSMSGSVVFPTSAIIT